MNATHRVRACRLVRLAALAALATILPACSGHATAASRPQAADASSAEPSSASAPSWNLVALGDSLSRPNECEGCSGYVDLYATAIARRSGITVDVLNDAAVQLSNVPPVDAGALLAQILTDGPVRRDIASADIVVISIGFNDTPWNRLDDPCNAASRYPVVQWPNSTQAASIVSSQITSTRSIKY